MQMTLFQRLRTRVYLFVSLFLRGMTLGARVMLVDGNRVLLIRHTYVPGWHFPGGGIEVGEPAEDAARRELREEAGYRFIGRPQLFGFYHNPASLSRRDYVALFVSRAYEVDHVFKPNREIAECAWFDRDALPQETSAGTRRRVEEVFGDGVADEQW